MDYVICNDELYHHGTKGMRWGIRKYQNKDGSLTPAGKRRYNAELQKLKDREAAIKGREKAKARTDKLSAKKAELDAREKALQKSGIKKTATQQKSKTADESSGRKAVKDMSDEELRKAVNRLRLEQEYRNLNPQQVSKGKKFVDTVMNKVLAPAAQEVSKEVAKKLLTSVADSAIGSSGKTSNDAKRKK